MDTSNSFTVYGECRCCLAQGYHRDITKEYYFNNIREVYDEIFKECFNLTLSTHMHITQLICLTCIQRLRDAISFRMMVVSTETHLLKAALAKDNKDTVFVNVTIDDNNEDIKSEVKVEDTEEFPYYQEELDEDYAFETTCPTYDNDSLGYGDESESSLEEIEGETNLLARFPKGSLQHLPKRCALDSICPDYVKYLEKFKDQVIKARDIDKLLNETRMTHGTIVTEKMANSLNATCLFENSNAIAFKTRMRSGYPCFYCRQIFNHKTLREHQSTHQKSEIYKRIRKYTKNCLVVYADITDLECTICNQSLKNLNELKQHLVNKHDKKMYLNYPDRVIPFKLKEKDFECQVCGVIFETFGAIERHMNKHFGHYICEECGAGFVTKHRLSIHIQSVHRIETYSCNVCKKNFASQTRFKIHYDAVHKMIKKYKCPECNDKFIDYFTRQKHLVEVHGNDPILYKCNVCDKAFQRRYGLSCHMKRTHLEQKDVKCDICPYMCYTNAELKEHMVKHGATRKFECDFCKKTFLRKKGWLNHLKTHDRSFKCTSCDKTFGKDGDLKTHMKRDHSVELTS